jgi:lysophospholipase L1-like esterase
MNTNPRALSILCFGDSNTYGTKPDGSGRFAVDERWTGVLQNALGDNYYVIEDGLGGRSTDLDHPNPNKPGCNGLAYFKPCIDAHRPLDMIVIMLGTNDLKVVYNRSAAQIAEVLRQYPGYVDEYCEDRDLARPKFILVSPAHINAETPEFEQNFEEPRYDHTSGQKSHQLAEHIERVAQETNCLFFNAAQVAQTGKDGLHLDRPSHSRLADSLAALIK